jgi:uncharacterized protein (TIGR02996 family)
MAKKRATPRGKTPTPPTAQDQAFLRAILAEPDDDTPRLVYADWLDEHGQGERAEFIRLQIERARRPIEDPAHATPTARESALLDAHREDWQQSLPEQLRRWPHHVEFQRGFPWLAHAEIESFLTWDDSIWQAAPLTALRLGDMVAANGEYREAGVKRRMMLALANKPQLTHLRSLDFGESSLLIEDVQLLLTSPYLTRLRYLSLTDIGHGDELVPLVIGTAALPALTGVNLEANQIGDEAVATLAASPFLQRLTNLCLGNSQLGDDGAEHLAASPHLANLEYLHLYCTDIGDRGASALAASPYLTRLRGLWLMATNVGPAGQAALRQRFGDHVAF